MSLSSAQPAFSGPESFSNGRLPFIEQRRTRTHALDPDRRAQQGCILDWKDTNGATVVENLFPDTLHCTVDSLIEGSLTCPIGEAPVEAV